MMGNKVLSHISFVTRDFITQQTLTFPIRQSNEFIFEVPWEMVGLQVTLPVGSVP